MSVFIDQMKLVSEANKNDGVGAKIHRKSSVKAGVRQALPEMDFPLPVDVRLTRVGSKELDDDNLRMSLKAVRDVVAEWLGLPDDKGPEVRWMYDQKSGYTYGCRIEIRTRNYENRLSFFEI